MKHVVEINSGVSFLLHDWENFIALLAPDTVAEHQSAKVLFSYVANQILILEPRNSCETIAD
jgi:hypothetical protein